MFGVLTGLELDHNNPYVGDLVSSLFESANVANASSATSLSAAAAALSKGGGKGGETYGGIPRMVGRQTASVSAPECR